MDEQEIRRRMFTLMHRFGKLNMALDLPGLSRGEYMMLEAAERYDQENSGGAGFQVSAIGKRLYTSPSAMSKMLGRMEKKGYIERAIDPSDHRNVVVRVTEEGRKRRCQARRYMDQFSERVIGRMGEKDMEQLLCLWGKLAEVMEQEAAACCERRAQDNDENHEISQ